MLFFLCVAAASFYGGRRCIPSAQLRHLRSLSRRDTLGAGLILTGVSSAQPARAMFGGAKTIPAPADVASPPPDAEVTKSGLASKVLTAGKGAPDDARAAVNTHRFAKACSVKSATACERGCLEPS